MDGTIYRLLYLSNCTQYPGIVEGFYLYVLLLSIFIKLFFLCSESDKNLAGILTLVDVTKDSLGVILNKCGNM